MQCEKNIAKSILKTLSGKKDTLEVYLDIKEASTRKHLWLVLGKKPGTAYYLNPSMF